VLLHFSHSLVELVSVGTCTCCLKTRCSFLCRFVHVRICMCIMNCCCPHFTALQILLIYRNLCVFISGMRILCLTNRHQCAALLQGFQDYIPNIRHKFVTRLLNATWECCQLQFWWFVRGNTILRLKYIISILNHKI